ncbi:MAG TPA: acyltransferase [Deltaproteobacteria bacterium]|nr:acyltransferase [Deltaproteobacteria bacterium]
MRAGFVQTSPRFGDVDRNVEDALRRIRRVEADLVVLPELFSTGYAFASGREARGLAHRVPGPVTDALCAVAAEKGLHIVAGLAERAGRRVYNSAVLVGPDGLKALYRKAHLFRDETAVFSPGDTPFEVHDIGAAKVGLMICFDWIFPEAARTLALRGAEILCHPSNLVLPYCPAAMVTRCIENRVFAVTANRVGSEERSGAGELRFIGKSQVVAPDGSVLVRASSTRPETRIVEVDPALARHKKITPVNDLFADRRRDLYE